MTTLYTSGELAKRCNVSIRTVQYYDREGILQAVKRNEQGNRLYGEEQVALLTAIRACKGLGMSLQEIRQISKDKDTKNPFYQVLMEQKKKNTQAMEHLKIQNDRIQLLLNEEYLNLHHMSEINALLETTHKKKNRRVNILLLVFILYLFPCMPFLIVRLGNVYLPLLVALVFLILLIMFHASNNAYCCPNCGKRFKLSVYKDMFTLNGGKKGKYLKCPYCEHKGWFEETHA